MRCLNSIDVGPGGVRPVVYVTVSDRNVTVDVEPVLAIVDIHPDRDEVVEPYPGAKGARATEDLGVLDRQMRVGGVTSSTPVNDDAADLRVLDRHAVAGDSDTARGADRVD